ncbi:wee1-like protein kinase 1-A [Patella vulgata]|uniref:wee1-like protein kinase 1-A n=1 Tax=Patella vulgata TaxID=6465 RepID=UPI0024A96235|nr:wee1-like protein kinase 1-A [Patella vulgata]
MACLLPKPQRGRRSILRNTFDEDCLVKTLTYEDLDMLNDTGFHESSSPFSDEIHTDYLDFDCSVRSPVFSPKPCRRITRSRKLSPLVLNTKFDPETDDEQVPVRMDIPDIPPTPTSNSNSPPHRRLRALRLFDTPHTPKSLLEKAQRQKFKDRKIRSEKKANRIEKVEANVNPFTPVNNRVIGLVGGKRNRTDMVKSVLDDSTDEDDDLPSSKKIALHEINTSRYNEEFYEMCKLGDGEYGSVHKCVHRLDGCIYAIKKSKTPVAGSVYERNAMNEVYAHAVLGKHAHVVRYFSAWAEDDHMYIQNEYCNGGSLAEIVEDNKRTGGQIMESELKQILYQVALGVKYIHSQNLVHLDIKPGNIFIHRNPRLLASPESGVESCEEEEECEEAVTYKIGDLGHVTSLANPVVEEGDCRYLPREILNENYEQLTKSDIFSLALSIYEAASSQHLPKNGEDWHLIRDGYLPSLPGYSKEFHSLLKSMIHPDPKERPSALAVVQHPYLCPQLKKTKAQLRKELNEERFKNQILSRQLIEATQFRVETTPLAQYRPTGLVRPFQSETTTSSTENTSRSRRLVGGRMKRSLSLSTF